MSTLSPGTSRRSSILGRVVALAPRAFGLGPAAVDGVSDPAGPRAVQFVVAGAALLVHIFMYLATGIVGFGLVALALVIFAVVGIPLTMRLADTDPAYATWLDLVTLAIAATLIGDPVGLVAWFPLVILANILYLDSVAAARHSLGMVAVVAVYFVVAQSLSNRLLDADTLRLYLAATLLMWAAAGAVYALAVGGAVNRRNEAVDEAMFQRDAAELRALAEASRLRAVLEEAPIGLLLQASDGSFLYGNGPALDVLGLSLDDLLSTGTATSMDPETRRRVNEEVLAARVTGEPFLLQHPTLAGRVVELRGRHVEVGGSFTTVSALRDLTPELDAHRQIERLSTLIELTETQMVIWDERGTIVVANRVFRELWSGAADAVGRPLIEVVGEQAAPFLAMPRLEDEHNYELEVALPDGRQIWVSVSMTDFLDPVEGRWLRSASVRDLTEVALARRQLEQLVASKDQFIASVSHELRTPLTVVVGLASEMANDVDRWDRSDLAEFAALIASQSTEVAALVDDLLTIARADAGVLTVQPTEVDLRFLVTEVLGGLPETLRSRVAVTGKVAAPVSADPVRVRQIVRNLITNAGRYGGPKIEVEVSAGRIEVRDDGPGVAEDQRDRMFEPYERAHHRAGTPDSVGLGLTVCRRLSRLMGGDVSYSHDGTWSIFALDLPAA